MTSGPAQMGTTGNMTGQIARHAFAGHGSLIKHHSWLLSGDQAHAPSVRSVIADVLHRRSIQALKLDLEKLLERGFWVEEREYLIMKRGVTTVFIYIAPAGQDLYISRATTVQLSYDPGRVIFFLLILAEIFLGPSIIQNMVTSMMFSSANTPGSSPGQVAVPVIIAVLIFILLYIPSLLILITFLIASFRQWLADKDFWVYLRRNVLNDFEIDDITLLERATDETVLAAVKQLSLDATKIAPPVAGYQTKQRVRLI